MSGGAFNYINMADFIEIIQEAITDDIRLMLSNKNYKGYSKKITKIFSKTIKELDLMEKKLHAIDYLLEGDFSEESFLKKWSEIK